MMCAYLFNPVYFCKLGAAFLYLQSVSASPTATPTYTPMNAWFPETSYSASVAGTNSKFGDSSSIYGQFVIVGSPSDQVGTGVRSGSVSIFTVFSSSVLADVSTFVLEIVLLFVTHCNFLDLSREWYC